MLFFLGDGNEGLFVDYCFVMIGVAGRDGYLDIESEPGEGSSFTVNFTEKREVTDRC